MAGPEFVVVVLGLMLGYWAISAWLNRKDPPPKRSETSPEQDQERPEPAPSGGYFQPEPAEAWHVVLDVSPEAAVQDIRRAYKRALSQYHPDKVASLGPEIRAVAERKSKQISLAYRFAMRLRGVSEQLW